MNPRSSGKPRILVVEDESLVAMLLEDFLGELGYAIVGPFARIEDALARLEEGGIDGALLDVNLAGERSYPIAEALATRGLPFTFVTGYGEAGIEPRFRKRPVVQKPFTQETLRRALSNLPLDPSGETAPG
jgi:CheY-like chemotaxis protein